MSLVHGSRHVLLITMKFYWEAAHQTRLVQAVTMGRSSSNYSWNGWNTLPLMPSLLWMKNWSSFCMGTCHTRHWKLWSMGKLTVLLWSLLYFTLNSPYAASWSQLSWPTEDAIHQTMWQMDDTTCESKDESVSAGLEYTAVANNINTLPVTSTPAGYEAGTRWMAHQSPA